MVTERINLKIKIKYALTWLFWPMENNKHYTYIKLQKWNFTKILDFLLIFALSFYALKESYIK